MSPDLAALMAKVARISAWAGELAAPEQPLRFRAPNGQAYLVSRDLEDPALWRVTIFDDTALPFGHYLTPTAYEAIWPLLCAGCRPHTSTKDPTP